VPDIDNRGRLGDVPRIVAGAVGGRRLQPPAGRGTRPTADRTREGLFSALEALRGDLIGAAFLDLYAGTGAVGFEAASRGADPVTLVERDPRTVEVIRRNMTDLGLTGVDVRSADVPRWLAGDAPAAYDIVFVDPPYADPVAGVLGLLATNGWIASGGVVVVERATRDAALTWPEGLTADRSRRYGDSTLWYGRRP
jgi:16S rRNA (guanine966-N2)-methyltransferase